MTKESGTVNIHGREYQTVASRVQRFREKCGEDYGIITELVEAGEDRVIMKASIGKGGDVIATGYAEERRDSSQINRTSALENAETSAIGRALAAFGLGGTEYATADEVATAIGQRAESPQPKPAVGSAPSAATARTLVSEAQVKLLLARSRDASGLTDRQDIYDFFLDEFGKMPNEVLRNEVDAVLKRLGGEA
jgi:hypothetical protein